RRPQPFPTRRSSDLALEVEEPAGRGLDPFLHRVFVEDESLVGAGDAPGAGRHLCVELARAPPGVTQTEECPARTGAAGDRLEDRSEEHTSELQSRSD